MRTTKPALILIAAFAFTLTALTQSNTTTQAKPFLSSRAGSIFQAASPSVVPIEAYYDKHEVNGAGCGFVASADGRIVTNYHVIVHTRQATVRLENNDAYDTVEVLDIDKRKNLTGIRHFFDGMVTRHAIIWNPALSVREDKNVQRIALGNANYHLSALF